MAELILSGIAQEQFQNIMRSIVREEIEIVVSNFLNSNQKSSIGLNQPTDKKYIYSIKELAVFLNCSPVTAQKLKNKGLIPCLQVGRKLMFDQELVIAAMTKIGKGLRK